MPTEDEVTRKLRAILSADVKGYSLLMADDETFTVNTLKSYRKVMSAQIVRAKGRVVDAPGDNLLAEFSSAVDAVQCAVEIQKILKEKNEDLPPDKRLEFRIGVNIGDVIQDGDNIYGAGVNVAARIEGLADAGGICISRNAYDHVKDKLDYGYEYLGEHEVKNIKDPVRVYKVLTDPEDAGKLIGDKPKPVAKNWIWATVVVVAVVITAVSSLVYQKMAEPDFEPASVDKMAYPLPDKPSIAVLPFVNISDDPKQEYLCDGLTEEIITALSKIGNMFVIARNSAFTYKGKAVNIQQVAEDLGVRYVLEGSVRKSQDRLRITTQLIDAVKGHHLWAERYDRKLKDLFVLQDEITMKIMTALRVELTAGEDVHQWERGTNNLEAYLKLLQARQVLDYTKEGVIGSQQLIKEAIAIDPQYAMAYRNLGVTYVIEHMMGLSKSPELSLERGMEMAQKAIALDGTLAEAHALVGRIYLAKGQYEKAIVEGEKACALDPNSDHVLAAFAYSLEHAERPEEAIEFYGKAIRFDPIPPNWFLRGLGRSYRDAGRYEEAIVTFKKVLQRSPNDHRVFMDMTITYSLSGREEEARAAATEALKINPKLSAEYFVNPQPYMNQSYKEDLIDILRKAGLP